MKNALLFSAALIFGTTFPAQARVEITIGKQADPIPLQTGILWLNQDPAALSPETDTLDNSSEQETIPADLDERTMQICPGVNLVTDIDGNHYNTIKIGDHCWMRENLKTTHYRNGTPIAYPGNDNTAWQNNTTGAYAWYNNDVGYKDKYGALYNWHAVNSSNGLCPVGWHMPEWYDYGNLINYAGGWSSPTGNKLKSCRQVGSPLGGDCDTQEHPRWHSHHIHYGTDDFGFSALPAGSRITAGSYFYMGFHAYFWTASEWNDGGEYYHLEYLDGGISAFSYENNYTEGFSVRCIWSGTLPSVTTSEITDITSYSAVGGGNVINTGTSMVTARGVVWSTEEYPTLENNQGVTFNLSGPGEFESQITGLLGNTTYYVRAYATNNTGTSYGNQVSFVTTSHLPCPGMPTITDVDGNIYSTVLIGNQCWMRENLRTTKYNDGTPIDNPLSETEWHDNTSGAYVWYDNNIGWKDSYGALYNWYAAVNAKGLCPEGWDVPTHDEWTALTNYIGGTDSPAGNHIKSCRQVNSPLGGECNTTEHPRWFQNANHYGIDQYGFNGLPGGTRSLSGFGNLEFRGYWWSSNEIGSTGLVRTRELFWNEGNVGVTSSGKSNGLSVRCLLNGSGTSDYFNIYLNVNPTGAGTVTGAGEHQAGSTVSITATANEGWVFVNWTGNISVVDDPNSPETSLTMPYGHIILTANFVEEEPLWPPCPDMPTITDIDGNIYNTVLIGEQCWTRENLKTTKYRNGTSIAYPGTDNNAWENNTTGAYAWYNNDMGWKDIYGALYNWYAVNNVNGLCPTGWKEPADADWTQLVNFVVSQGYPNTNLTNGAGNALKSCRQVDSPLGEGCNTTAHPRWDSNDTHYGFDEFGFAAFPGSWRYETGQYSGLGGYGMFWSKTEYDASSAYSRSIYSSAGNISRPFFHSKARGYSIRCVLDPDSPTSYYLQIDVNPSVGGTVTGLGEHLPGTQVSIVATANEGWEFVNWTGDIEHIDDVNSASATVTMPGFDIYLAAHFEPIGLNDVETLAELRTKPPGETIYHYTGEAVIVAMDDFQNRKYIQDATAAIFINDQPGNITTQYALYDVISQVTGQIEIINNMVRFLPSENAPPALGNTPVEPYLLALNEITPNDQAKLIKLFNVTFQDIHAGQVFANGQSYTITDGINSLVVRTHFWDVDYIGETIPGGAVNITGVVTQFHDVMQITPRFAADIENYVEPGAHTLILNVDMAYATNFNPDNDLVYVTGTFAGFWPVPGTDPENQLMTRVDETMTWTKTLFLEEGVYEYKYFLNDGWGGGEWGETINRTIYIDNDTIIHDIWGHFVLELDAQPTAGGTLSGGGIHPFSAIVPVEANPLPGWEFINWTGDIEHVHNANSSGTTVTMPASDVSLTANFAITGIPENLDLSNETIADGDTECFDALQTITVSDFTVEAGGSVTLIAGESILLLAGTTVEHGGYLLARIAAREDDYCGIPRAMKITKEPVGSKGEDVIPSDLPSVVRENGFFKLYPNPTDGTFTLELTSAELEKTITVEIHSILGNRLFRKELPAQRLHTISLESQQPGIYIIRVMKGENVGVERLIKR